MEARRRVGPPGLDASLGWAHADGVEARRRVGPPGLDASPGWADADGMETRLRAGPPVLSDAGRYLGLAEMSGPGRPIAQCYLLHRFCLMLVGTLG